MTVKGETKLNETQMLQCLIEGLQEKKGRGITHIDLSGIEDATTRHFLIANGNTPIQVAAIADAVRDYAEEHAGQRPYNYDGYRNSQWIVLDYGYIYVHVFLPEERMRYNIEQLWADAPRTDIPDIY